MEKTIQDIFVKYKGTRENIIPILQEVQEEYTYLPEGLLAEIASHTNIPASENVTKFVCFNNMTFSANSCIEENNDPSRLRRVPPNRGDVRRAGG